MERKKVGFDDKFLSKLGKIDSGRIRDYLAQVLSQKNFLETIFDHLNEGIVVTDNRLRILYSNRTARRMLQWPADRQFLGETLPDHTPGGELRETLESMQLKPRPIEGYECRFGADEKRRVMLTAIAARSEEEPSLDADTDEDLMWVFLLRDVTERYRTLEERARAQRLASMALLTSGVAHEIKNPLNSLNIHAQILQREAEDDGEEGTAQPVDRDKVARASKVILEETARLTDIVNEFIQAARPQQAVMQRESFNRIAGELVEVFGPECEQLGIELKTELDPELPPIDMDPYVMFQALRNLIRNAIEAHEQQADASDEKLRAEPPRMIVIRTRLAADTVAVEVADNGPGIEEENIDKIFEPYYTTKFNGTGLGLMIVYRIVTQHFGAIHVDSEPGVGTRFIISLPLAERPVRLLEKPKPTPVESAR